MNINLNKASSRYLGVAQSLVGKPINEEQVFSKSVVLIGEHDALKTQNGVWCFIDSLRLLVRVVGQLTICIPPGLSELEAEARMCCSQACLRGEPQFIISDSTIPPHHADAILNIGSRANSSLPWTTVSSNGWVARISSGSQELPTDYGQPNPIAALFAASLGVTEVFKRIYGVPASVAPLLDRAELSLFENTTEFDQLGPLLPEKIFLPSTLLVGAGAIGNAIALLMSQLAVDGRLHIVDKQDYQDENHGTSVLVENNGWIGKPKAERLAKWLTQNSLLKTTGDKALVSDALGSDAVKSMTIDLVLNGLDDVKARHDSQLAWPTIIVDGGINETGAAVIQHRLDERGLACLICSFKLPKQDSRETQRLLTGLNSSSLTDQGRVLTEQDIIEADVDKQEWLRAMLKENRTICSIVSQAGLRRLGVNSEDGFRPSVPFVATAAAAMVVSEALKALLYPDKRYSQRFTIGNLFLGTQSLVNSSRHAEPTCSCVKHRSLIDSLHQRRKQKNISRNDYAPHLVEESK